MSLSQLTTELQNLKRELESRISRTHKHTYQRNEPVSAKFDEQVVETENDSLVMALEAEGLDEIAQINRALQRIEDGSYGRCEACGEKIGKSRLEAIPFAIHCINCAS